MLGSLLLPALPDLYTLLVLWGLEPAIGLSSSLDTMNGTQKLIFSRASPGQVLKYLTSHALGNPLGKGSWGTRPSLPSLVRRSLPQARAHSQGSPPLPPSFLCPESGSLCPLIKQVNAGCPPLLNSYFLPQRHIQEGSTWLLSSHRAGDSSNSAVVAPESVAWTRLHASVSLRKSHSILEENCGHKNDSVSMVLLTQ